MQVGDKVIRTPLTFVDKINVKNERHAPMKGTVVYIHPEGRYHTVEFEMLGGKIKESFKGITGG